MDQNQKQAMAVLSGNELIVQGGLEAGFSLYTGYPGSPLADYFNILHQREKEWHSRGIEVVVANNEASAAAMASGAKQAGRDCLVAMKSMGLQVASDALSVGNFANPGKTQVDPQTGEELKAGVVVAVGDDPWSLSTSAPVDSRYLFKHLHIPFLEPSTPQELKDWMGKALTLSRRSSVYQGVLLNTFMAEGGGRVELGDLAPVKKEKEFIVSDEIELSSSVMVPPNSLKADQKMIQERFPRVQKVLRELNLDQSFGLKEAKIGLISAGALFETVKQVMEETEGLEEVSLYKVAGSFPLVDELLVPWLKSKETLIVLEEKRGFLEGEIQDLCQRHGLTPNIWGKEFKKQKGIKQGVSGFPAFGGLSFELVRDHLISILESLGISVKNVNSDASCASLGPPEKMILPRRLPTFCPGCPHRETLSLLKDLRKTLKEKGVDLLSHGDVGCYSLSFLPPFKEMHNLSAMGQGGGLGAGVDLFSQNPSVVLMGDSTFFHSGMANISNSVQMDHQITYILLDNDNTAMTGHQLTPVSGKNILGQTRPRQDLVKATVALGVKEVIEVDPSDRYFYQNILQEFIEKPGVKVIVSNKECALTFHGRQREEERKLFSQDKVVPKKTFYHINTQTCEDCRECVDATGCPGLTQVFDAYGTKVAIDPQICVGDSYCTKIKACPSFEKVDVFYYHPTKWKEKKNLTLDLESTPLPKTLHPLSRATQGDHWRAVVTGVGGSGVTTITRLLSKAACEMGGREGLDFRFVDQKGLAQRNGNVTGHLALYPQGKSFSVVTPRRSADLLFSPDLLDGAGKINFLKEGGLAVFDEDFQVPLELLLGGQERGETLMPSHLRKKLKEEWKESVQIFPFKKICEQVLGRSVYASTALLGAAFQSGRLPFSLQDIRQALNEAVSSAELSNNELAFEVGRKMWWAREQGREEEFLISLRDESHQSQNPLLLFECSLKESLLPWKNKKTLLKSYRAHLKCLEDLFPELKREDLAQYMHDLYIYDRGKRGEEFLACAQQVGQLYEEKDLKPVALRTLAKTFFIKDEVFISHTMISSMAKEQRRRLYGHLGPEVWTSYINRPHFDLLGMEFEFDLHPKTWMLKIMRHGRFLRWLLPAWHRRERKIAIQIRQALLRNGEEKKREEKRQILSKLDHIKGYRQIRYESAQFLAP